MENLHCPLYEQAQHSPHVPALITSEQIWTYEQLDQSVNAVCNFLELSGIEEKQRIAFIAHSNVATIQLFFALFRLQAIACPLSYRLPPGLLHDYIQRLKAHHILDPSRLPHDMTCVKNKPIVISSENSATFLFTSGSTSIPKIACHSFGNHYYNAQGVLTALKLERTSRWLLSLPFFHVSGISILFRCFLSGAAIVLSDLAITEAIPKFAITHASVVPTQLLKILQEPVEKINNPLKFLLLGGAPLSRSFFNEAYRQSLPIHTTYGMTEMSSIITLSGENPPGHAGKVMPFRELKIENGEICVRGKTLFQGYWDTLNETIQDIPEWFPTKDLGRFTPDGNLEVIGRKDRQFISGGENIQPEEIEQALCAIPGIRQACVLPIPDPVFGERPMAFIDDDTPLHTLESIRQALKNSLPAFKHPIYILPYPKELGIKPSLALLKQHLPHSLLR